jgi:hypothetical protein
MLTKMVLPRMGGAAAVCGRGGLLPGGAIGRVSSRARARLSSDLSSRNIRHMSALLTLKLVDDILFMSGTLKTMRPCCWPIGRRTSGCVRSSRNCSDTGLAGSCPKTRCCSVSVSQSEEQNGRVAMGRPHALHRRRRDRTRQQHRRKIHPPGRADPKECLFAGSDGGAEHRATIASPVETRKINDVNRPDYLTDVISRIVNGHPNSDIDSLSPWTYRKQELKAVASDDAYVKRLPCTMHNEMDLRTTTARTARFTPALGWGKSKGTRSLFGAKRGVVQNPFVTEVVRQRRLASLDGSAGQSCGPLDLKTFTGNG